MLNEKKYDMNKLHKNLSQYFLSYYKGLVSNQDEDFPLLETNFYLHVKKTLAILAKSGFKVINLNRMVLNKLLNKVRVEEKRRSFQCKESFRKTSDF